MRERISNSMLILCIIVAVLLVIGCSASRNIPQNEISKFSSLKSLYEAKYKGVGLNEWREFGPSSPQVEFTISTNANMGRSRIKDFLDTTQAYCSSKGGRFTVNHVGTPTMSVHAATRQEFEIKVQQMFENAKKRPFITCTSGHNILFEGIYSAYSYTAGGLKGMDIHVWMHER